CSTARNLFTVPDAHVVADVEPGNGQVGVQWSRGTNATGGDPGGVIRYDIIVKQTSPSGSTTTDFYAGDTPTSCASPPCTSGGPGDFSKIVTLPSGANGPPAKTFSVQVEARNNAGDSDASNAMSTSPCSTCDV